MKFPAPPSGTIVVCRPGDAGPAHTIDELERSGRRLIAAPGDVAVGTDERQSAPVERPRAGRINIEDRERNAALCGRVSDARHANRRVESYQRVAGPERIVERVAVAEPQVRRAAAWDGRRREIPHRVGRVALAVVSNDRRCRIVISKVEAARTLPAGGLIIGLLADARTRGIADQAGFLNLGWNGAVLAAGPGGAVFGKA